MDISCSPNSLGSNKDWFSLGDAVRDSTCWVTVWRWVVNVTKKLRVLKYCGSTSECLPWGLLDAHYRLLV